MTIAPRAARCASSISLPHATSCIWVSDDLLSDAIRRFSHTFRRHGSSVPGPLEARRRAARRHHTNLASVAGGAPPPDIATLFGTGEQKGWWKDPLSIDAGSTNTPHLSFFDLANDLTTNLDVRPPQPWIPPETPPVLQTAPPVSTIEYTTTLADEATGRTGVVRAVEAIPYTPWVEQFATMSELESSTNELNELEIPTLNRSPSALQRLEEPTLEEVKSRNVNKQESSEVELDETRPIASASQAGTEAFKPLLEASALAEKATQAAIHFQDPVLTVEKKTTLNDVRLLLNDAAYQRLRRRGLQEIELSASRMNTSWPDFLQRSRAMLEADSSSAKLLIRLIRHNIKLQKALGRGHNRANAVPRERSPAAIRYELVRADAEQSVVDIARLFALQPGPSPKTKWDRVYWCYQYLKHHQGYVSDKILPALWHAGVTNYLQQGLAQIRLDWVVAKVGDIESTALAQALLKNAGLREQFENAFRSGNQFQLTSGDRIVHLHTLFPKPSSRKGPPIASLTKHLPLSAISAQKSVPNRKKKEETQLQPDSEITKPEIVIESITSSNHHPDGSHGYSKSETVFKKLIFSNHPLESPADHSESVPLLRNYISSFNFLEDTSEKSKRIIRKTLVSGPVPKRFGWRPLIIIRDGSGIDR